MESFDAESELGRDFGPDSEGAFDRIGRRRMPDQGRPPSRAKANIMRLVDVTVAKPPRYWETAITRKSRLRTVIGARTAPWAVCLWSVR